MWTRLDSFAIEDTAARLPSGDLDGDGRPEIVLADAKTGRILLISVETGSCVDGESCTTDTCNKGAGCKHGAKQSLCDDGDPCKQDDSCIKGSCSAGATALDCDDGNACTTDACAPKKGCTHANVANGTACSDGNTCTVNDTCSEASCAAGSGLSCDDSDVCTDDSCDPSVGCLHQPNAASCNDGDACTDSDACNGGACAGSKVNCDDSDICTDDVCDPSAGCKHPFNVASCDDGDACSDTDTCSGGACAGSKVNCNDGNACTDDSCDPSTGCAHIANTTNCDDGDACTTGDQCAATSCKGTPKVCAAGTTCSTATATAGQCLGQCTNKLELASGGMPTFVIRSGTLWAWGPNADYRLGLDDITSRNNEVQIGAASDWAMVSASGDHTAAIKTDGTLWTWGKGTSGALGHGDAATKKVPTQVVIAKDWAVVSAGIYHTAAVKTDGTLWVWGKNTNGQLCGAGGGVVPTPTQIGQDKSWKFDNRDSISAMFINTMAIASDGSIWGCGQNEAGSLAVGHTSQVNTLTREATSSTGFVRVFGHRLVSIGIKGDGSLWTAGQAQFPRLARSCSGAGCIVFGQEATLAKDWKLAALGGFHVNALKTDGTLLSVGNDEGGVLWLGYIQTNSNWVKSPGTGFIDIGANYYGAYALKSDGSHWASGGNGDGALGIGTAAASVFSDGKTTGSAPAPTVKCLK